MTEEEKKKYFKVLNSQLETVIRNNVDIYRDENISIDDSYEILLV